MIELPVKGIPSNIIEKRKYFSKYENTPWHKNWNGDYDNYLEALNNLTKGESRLLFSDVVKASPKVGEYYSDENTFINAAKDGKVGIVHNSISPSSISGAKLNYLPSKEPNPIEVPLPDDNLKVSLKNKYNKPSVKSVDKSNKKDKGNLKGVLPDWGFNKLGKTSGGQSFIRGTNKVSFNNKGLVSQRKNWLEDKIGEPLLELISDNKNKKWKKKHGR